MFRRNFVNPENLTNTIFFILNSMVSKNRHCKRAIGKRQWMVCHWKQNIFIGGSLQLPQEGKVQDKNEHAVYKCVTNVEDIVFEIIEVASNVE